MAAGLCMTLVLGIGMGIIMAWRRNGGIDIGGTIVALVFQATPPFITGLLLLMVLSYRMGLFPTGGMYTPGARPDWVIGLLMTADFWHRLVLPTITVGMYYISTPMLIMRDGMLEVLGSDYIELARAKGLKARVIMLRHAARNALLGVVTIAGIMIGFAVGGQVVVESLFSWPGMGQLMVESAASHDYPVAQGTFPSITTIGTELISIPGSPPTLVGPVHSCHFAPRCPLSDARCEAANPEAVDMGGGHMVRCVHRDQAESFRTRAKEKSTWLS